MEVFFFVMHLRKCGRRVHGRSWALFCKPEYEQCMAAVGNAHACLSVYLLLTVLLTGCGGCTEEQLLENLNNGNADPEVLIV